MKNPGRLERENKELFGRWSDRYDSRASRRIFFERTYRHTIGILKKQAAFDTPLKFLDVACGTGEIIYRLAQEFPRPQFIGVDFVPAMLTQARAKSAGLSNVSWIEALASNLPFPDATFDVILCSDAFHHFPRPEETLREINRVLKPGGLFLLVDPSIDSLGLRILFNPLVRRLEHAYHYYYSVEMIKLLQTRGFGNISATAHDFNNYFISKKISSQNYES